MATVTIRQQFDTPDGHGNIGTKTSSIKAALELLALGQEFYFEAGSDASMIAAINAALPFAISAKSEEIAKNRAIGAVAESARKAAMAALIEKINAAVATLKDTKEVSKAHIALSGEYAALRQQDNGFSNIDAENALKALLELTSAVKSDDLEAMIFCALKNAPSTYEQMAAKLGIDEFKVSRKMAGMAQRKVISVNRRGIYSLV